MASHANLKTRNKRVVCERGRPIEARIASGTSQATMEVMAACVLLCSVAGDDKHVEIHLAPADLPPTQPAQMQVWLLSGNYTLIQMLDLH